MAATRTRQSHEGGNDDLNSKDHANINDKENNNNNNCHLYTPNSADD